MRHGVGFKDEFSDVPYCPDDIRNIQDIVCEKCGYSRERLNRTLVYSRVSRRVRVCNFSNFSTYIKFVTSSLGTDEFDRMIDVLTTNVTSFFRENHHFKHMSRVIMPELISRARRGAPVRIWSSACSSGEEAYSIAMTILSSFPEALSWDIKVLATDISAEMIDIAKSGIYSRYKVEKLSDDTKSQWFFPVNDHFSVVEQVKSMVTFRRLNLLSNWPFSRDFLVIFCRNVTIYFEEGQRNLILSRLFPCLSPGGYLYLGHSEKIPEHLIPMALSDSCPNTYYKRIQ
ncbi:protein-glutamate O-methyltransferase [Acetobacter sacchari]|uniref:Chemotaxis protein methyltransferase n=1 Tax=Acetobacter sacchari TaxID=2661687 RepID=A0ABS3LY25_9PROT|nr:protein-glutamate O-methyltransferase [Acetobacter sacchari]